MPPRSDPADVVPRPARGLAIGLRLVLLLGPLSCGGEGATPDPAAVLPESVTRAAAQGAVEEATDLYLRWHERSGRHDPDLLDAIVAGASRHPTLEVRLCGVLAAGRAFGSADWRDVQRLAAGSQWWMRMEAARLARRFGGPEGDGLAAQLARDADWRVRAMATGELEDPAAGENEADRAVVETYLVLVHAGRRASDSSAEGGGRALAALEASLTSGTWLARWLAAQTVGHLELREALPLLERVLESGDRWVRRAGVQALGDVAAHESAGRLAQALADRDEGVRVWAARGLRRVTADASRSE